jgi:hypothetical protein
LDVQLDRCNQAMNTKLPSCKFQTHAVILAWVLDSELNGPSAPSNSISFD